MQKDSTSAVRLLLRKYETIVEAQRLQLSARRARVLSGEDSTASDLERQVLLETIDDLWADYLTAVSDLRADARLDFARRRQPLREVHRGDPWHVQGSSNERSNEEWPVRLDQAVLAGVGPRQRGATWTYLTTDEPFGHLTERIMRGLKRMIQRF